jgi:integral membrane protein
MFKTPVGRVRGVGMIEGVSFLVLLLIAMPLKYLFKLPEGEAIVFWVGMAHGILFLAYAVVAYTAWKRGHLTDRLFGIAALASVLPFGPFVIDRWLWQVEKEVEEARRDTTSTAG